MIKMPLPSQIIDRDDHQITVVRTGSVQYIDGKPNQGTQQTFNISGNVQPLEGRELLIVPEGDRYKEQYFLYARFALQTGDQVTWSGVNFQVQEIQRWGSFHMARIMRIDVGSNASAGS